MAALQFITSNPVADEMDKQAQIADERRLREQQEFQARYQHETQIGLDNAMREGLSSIYPEPAGAPASAPVASPGAAPAAAPAGTTSPSQAVPGAAPSVVPVDPNAALMRRLAQTPGGGQAAFQLHQSAQNQQAAARKELNDRIYEAFKSNDPTQLAYARTLAEQNGINIQPELWTNAQSRAKFVGMVEQMKSMGLEPHQMGQYLRGAQSAQGGDDMAQLQAGLSAVPRESKIGGTITGQDGTVYFYDDQGGVRQATFSGQPVKGSVGRGRSSLASAGANVQSIRPLADGTYLAVYRDGRTEMLKDASGNPYIGPDPTKFAGQAFLDFSNNPMIDDPMRSAQGAAAQIYGQPRIAPPPKPMPQTQAELIQGETYQTRHGPARWNGTAFETTE